ncbi:MAG: hypothetical protein SFH39_00665 [Candidatus Magnetobacterium sp. LHC-1]|uniref:Uncharacterized protein n=1 Tax=Candidatus Magnetobacterium casense TaxID=1455061 RepID=A0ABS6S0P4_9BACT|nr:hypothetical protein [Candidatus Magnetobacterium casensis]MBF0607982.1 hypothetical protein [Nitrospirota bacterium]MBV6342425.1 hypothetical protein [Candidatus Magnetobacterium casensis]
MARIVSKKKALPFDSSVVYNGDGVTGAEVLAGAPLSDDVGGVPELSLNSLFSGSEVGERILTLPV